MNLVIHVTSSCFIEIAKTIARYFGNKGINVNISKEMDDINNHYICIGAHDIYWDISAFSYEVYQFEQIDSPYMKTESYMTILRNAKKVYDFSHIGAKYIKDNVIETVEQKNYIAYPGIIKKSEKIYDISFIGSLNDRRNNIMDNNVSKWNNLSKKEFDNVVYKSKILLNLHYYPTSALEVARIEELLSLGAFIISERSTDIVLDSYYEKLGLVVFIDDIAMLYYIITEYLHVPGKMEQFMRNVVSVLKTRQTFSYDTCVPIKSNISIRNIYPELDYLPFKTAETHGTNNQILKLNTSAMLPPVSLITITRNRAKFIKLMLSNFFSFKYAGKIEWIILDDSPDREFNDEVCALTIPNLKYVWIPRMQAMSISEKRNLAISHSSYDIIAHMDDDDYYYPYSLYSVSYTHLRAHET
jgi:hypothetical protein